MNCNIYEMNQGSFPVKPEFFPALFQPLKQVVHSTVQIMLTFISLLALQNMFHFIFQFIRFPPSNELTIACSPVSLISSMDRALRLVNAKVRVRFPIKPEFFQVLFQPLWLLFLLLRSYSFSLLQITMHYIVKEHQTVP